MNRTHKRIRDFVIMVVIPALIGLVMAVAMTAKADAAGAQGPGQRVMAARCALVIDADSGAPISRKGDCNVRRAPESTFKIPLAIMGFDSGVLKDAHDPAWDYDGRFPAPQRDHKRVDPTVWERDSVVWFSRELNRRMAQKDGPGALKAWVDRLGYGNRDASGDPGRNNGLTNAWLNSSLKISPDEQAAFLRRLLRDELPASQRAQALTRSIIPTFTGKGGWTVRGKTGSTGRLQQGEGVEERGWFVGWAEKAGRRVIFAVHQHDRGGADDGTFAGPRVRDWTLTHFDQLAEPAAQTAPFAAPEGAR